jgi:hypothetical protein
METAVDSLVACARLVWHTLGRAPSELALTTFSYAHGNETLLMAWGVLGLALVAFMVRRLRPRAPGRRQILLPSLTPIEGSSFWRGVRHMPAALLLIGVMFFLIALADPHRTFLQEEVSAPGRRIALLVDASGSMGGRFDAPKLKARQNVGFYTAVAAAERFVHLRMDRHYQDLIGLVEFASNAYVITPFTDDYGTILLSLSLIGEPDEWARFPESGTVMIGAIGQGVELFKLFGFLHAAGNVMVVFSDARDTQVILEGRTLESIVAEARRNHVPIYLIRTASGRQSGPDSAADPIWSNAVRRTGGRFYAAASEDAILDALDEIDRAASGRIVRTRYGTQEPHFAFFALVAVSCWTGALASKLTWRGFRQFP